MNKLIHEFKCSREASSQIDHKDNILKSELTDRQLEVLEMVARGKPYKEIGDYWDYQSVQ